MSFAPQPLGRDISGITGKPSGSTSHRVYSILHTEDEDMRIPRILRVSYVLDYSKSMAEQIHVDTQMESKDYFNVAYKNRRHLEMTIVIESDSPEGVTINETRYKASFSQGINGNQSISDEGSAMVFSGESGSITNTSFILNRREYEPMISKKIQGVYSGGSRKSMIVGVVSKALKSIIVDGMPVIDNVEMVDPDNTSDVQQIIIESYTRAIDIPSIIQEKHGGIYRGGSGTFFQRYRGKKTFFIFPYMVNKEDLNNTNPRLRIFAGPGKVNTAQPSTWSVNGNILDVVCTGSKAYRDNEPMSVYSEGIGIASIEASSMLDDSIDVVGGKVRANSARLNSVYGDEPSPDGLDYTKRMNPSPTTNGFSQISRSMESKGSTAQFIWDNSSPEHLMPGMVTEVLVSESGAPNKKTGRLIKCHHSFLPVMDGFTNDRFYSTSELSVFTELVDDNYA